MYHLYCDPIISLASIAATPPTIIGVSNAEEKRCLTCQPVYARITSLAICPQSILPICYIIISRAD